MFDVLEPVSAPEAALGAGARYPPPLCHPGSRKTINHRLREQLLGGKTDRQMTWLYGPAGVGKSAVAQTFGEQAANHDRLGAAFFFAAMDDKRSNPLRVIPTLAYQLAIRDPYYKQLITHQLASDPSVLHATLRVQFQKLIVKPFSLRPQTPNIKSYIIILDGLDECKDEDAQCELVELINDSVQKHNLPLIWLVCSRPEPHIKYTFSQLEYSLTCDREELLIDAEARADVELFLRESFQKIRLRYRSIISTPEGTTWPSETIFDKISQTSSGYFAFSSTVVRVIGDRTVGNPDVQLIALVNMFQGLDKIGLNNPLQALDIFYSRIISRVPEHILPATIKILGICARGEPHNGDKVLSAENFWLFLRIKSGAFYHALEKLHSVLRIPPPEDAQSESLSFYHKSFSDYLENPRRSGKFYFSKERVRMLVGIGNIYWRNHCGTGSIGGSG